MHSLKQKTAFMLATTAALLPGWCLSQEKITLLYAERPPYSISAADGSAYGLTGTPTANAFKKAGIPHAWVRLSFARQMDLIKKNDVMACAVGGFRNTEREAFVKFSKAIYQDKPLLIMTPKKLVVQSGSTMEQVLSMKGVRVLVKAAYSYGGMTDALLKKIQPATITAQGEVFAMVQMLRANRADIMIAPEEEATYLIEQAGFHAGDFNLVKLRDALPGEKRHILCSKKVPDDVMQRLNDAIEFQ